jgi:hypothetical protein
MLSNYVKRFQLPLFFLLCLIISWAIWIPQAIAKLSDPQVGQEVEVLHSPAESGGVSHLCADIAVAQRLSDYKPRVNLAQGLHLTLERDSRFQR